MPPVNSALTIREIPIHEIKPAKYNPRKDLKPDDPEYIRLKKALDTYGLVEPLIWNQRSGNLVGGHQRLKILTASGRVSAPCSVVDLDDTQEKALNIALNKQGGDWDMASLSDLLKELSAGDFDKEVVGFSDEDFQRLMISTQGPGLTDEDAVPDPPKVAITKPGDLWILGKHKILCGDATSATDVARLLGQTKPALMLSDPPYGINIVKVVGSSVGGSKPVTINQRTGTIRAHGASPFGGKKKQTATVGGGKLVDANEYYPIYGDDKPFNPEHLIGVAANHILFGGNYFASKLPDGRCWLVWDKNNTGHFADAELAWTDIDHGVKLYHHTWNGLVREGNRKDELAKRVHPTQKPVGLFAEILQDFSPETGSIADFYLGSGTTLIACEKTGRTIFAMEIDPHYVDVCVKRWEDFTGLKAVLEVPAAAGPAQDKPQKGSSRVKHGIANSIAV